MYQKIIISFLQGVHLSLNMIVRRSILIVVDICLVEYGLKLHV